MMKPSLPALSLDIVKNFGQDKSMAPISHISTPANFEENTILGLSLLHNGGVAIFDLRLSKKVMHMAAHSTRKTLFYEGNPFYMGILSTMGALELYDCRNVYNGPVNVYNTSFVEQER